MSDRRETVIVPVTNKGDQVYMNEKERGKNYGFLWEAINLFSHEVAQALGVPKSGTRMTVPQFNNVYPLAVLLPDRNAHIDYDSGDLRISTVHQVRLT